jgi:flagellar hook-associated protein 1 FlgK
MTIPSFTGLQTALSGLEAAQAAITTTGENIANANTTGYTRQTVQTAATSPLNIASENGGIQIGTGVSITDVNRVRNQFLDVQYRAQNSATSNANSNATELGQVQTAVSDSSSSGLQTAMSNFWSAWSTLGTTSGSSQAAALQNVVNAGQTLTSTFNTVAQQMQTVQSQASQQYSSLTGTNGQVAQDAQTIATLNAQISQASQAGISPNTLLDQRDSALDDLSSLANISVSTGSDGAVTVNFGDASTPLVSGTTVTWPQTLTSAAGGQLGSLLNMSSSTGPIGQYLSQLDSVANQVVSSVNALQPSSPFFTGTSASTIAVSANTSSVQAASSSTSGNDLAQSIGNLSGGAADQSYAAFVASIGGGVQAAQSTQSTQQAVLTAVSNQRQSVSGVSLDEEMTNLIQYQQAYQASARVMNAINTTLDTLINTVGGGL